VIERKEKAPKLPLIPEDSLFVPMDRIRFSRWLSGTDWDGRAAVHRMPWDIRPRQAGLAASCFP